MSIPKSVMSTISGGGRYPNGPIPGWDLVIAGRLSNPAPIRFLTAYSNRQGTMRSLLTNALTGFRVLTKDFDSPRRFAPTFHERKKRRIENGRNLGTNR